jgi:uncharacterized OsmC-like protein
MNAIEKISATERYARCVQTSKRVRWDIDQDVIRGRRFDTRDKFLPDGLSLAGEFTTLSPDEKRLVSQIQGRTYANIFGLVERFINAKVLELSEDHWFGDQSALEALVRFSDEELKHQELFRRIDRMIGEVLPEGYRFDIDPNEVAHAVLGKSTWAVLALTLDIELFTQLHYRQSIEPNTELSDLFKDVFLYHWREESQHAILDELEWLRHDAELTPEERDRAVDQFIELVVAVDGILQAQARSDGLLFGKMWPADSGVRDAGHRAYVPQGLPLAIHPFRRSAPTLWEGAVRPYCRTTRPAHSGGAGDSPMIAKSQPTKSGETVMTVHDLTRDKTNVINGINVDDLLSLIDSVRPSRTKGKTNWQVTTSWQGQARTRALVESFTIGGERVPRRFSIDIDEPLELGGSNRFANPQEYLLAALNACMTVGYVAQCAVRGIELEKLEIETHGEIDLRGFLGIDPAVPPGYDSLTYTVRIKGNGTKEEFQEIHKVVMATSPNFHNVSRPIDLKPTLVVE